MTTLPGLTNNAALALFDEFNDLIDLRARGQFGPDRIDCLASVVLRAVNKAERLFDPLHAFERKAAALQADEINAAHLRWIPVRDHEGWNVLHNFGAAARDRISADPAKLMDGGETTNDRMIADLDVAGQGSVIGKHDRVANLAIVADVAVGKKISAVTDAGLARTGRAAINGYEFRERILVAGFKIGRVALDFKLLGLLCEGGSDR